VLYAAGLTWLLVRLKGSRPALRTSAMASAVAGALVGTAGILATYSVVSLPRSALLVFPASFLAVLATGGTASALVLTAVHPWRRVVVLFGLSLAVFVLGVVLQNTLFQAPH